MANNIIQFPDKSTREWESVRKLILPHIAAAGLSERESKEFESIIKPIYESFSLELQIPKISSDASSSEVALHDKLTEFVTSFQQHIAKLFSETLTREINHYISTRKT